MILTSPSKDVDQAPPVTTTFDAPEGEPSRLTRSSRRTRREPIDWIRVERLHAFVRARALEALDDAVIHRDIGTVRVARENVLAIDAMLAQARRSRGVVAACAITFFRARAMRDAQHPHFRGEWLGTAPHARSA